MHSNVSSLLGVVLVATAGLVSYGQISKQPATYTAVTVAGVADTAQGPSALNNLGDVIGRPSRSFAAGSGATVWSRAGAQMNQLSALAGGDYSSASAINDEGEVAGAANTGESIIPFVWTTSGGVQRIPLLPGDNCGQPFSINKHGNVVGYSSGPNGVKAVLWTAGAGVQNLGTLHGGSYSRARDINDSNEIVGTVKTASGDRAVLWAKVGNVRNLGALPGDTSSEATAINNAGDVVGYSNGPQGARAFLWSRATGMQNLGVLRGGNFSRALDINDAGEVVGTSTSSSGDRAFVWTRGAGMQDLNDALSNDVGVVLVEAHAINNKGQILVMGMERGEAGMNDQTHAHQHNVCAPAPEATYLLTPAR
jgi:probable HAF family extracellular repeat protein